MAELDLWQAVSDTAGSTCAIIKFDVLDCHVRRVPRVKGCFEALENAGRIGSLRPRNVCMAFRLVHPIALTPRRLARGLPKVFAAHITSPLPSVPIALRRNLLLEESFGSGRARNSRHSGTRRADLAPGVQSFCPHQCWPDVSRSRSSSSPAPHLGLVAPSSRC
jgi:hypothetical protein